MSRWTHSICDDCWKKREPSREPHRIKFKWTPGDGVNQSHCCFCGSHHSSGIFVREDPQVAPCKSQGPEHEEEE